MKHQYFGDINDYKKYGLLKILSGNGSMKISICWMLTESDNRTDGRKITYLLRPDLWRQFDPVLFDALKNAVERNIRSVHHAEKAKVLPSAAYYTSIVSDEGEFRSLYFKEFSHFAKGSDLVFFDPDNGLDIKSVPYGKRGSSKYLYREELIQTYKAGYSLIFYQHYPRVVREDYIKNIRSDIKMMLNVGQIYLFSTSHVLFILIPQKQHINFFIDQCGEVDQIWNSYKKPLFQIYQ